MERQMSYFFEGAFGGAAIGLATFFVILAANFVGFADLLSATQTPMLYGITAAGKFASLGALFGAVGRFALMGRSIDQLSASGALTLQPIGPTSSQPA